MARPKKTKDERRDDVLGVRLTDPERAELDEAAALHGLSASEFMRRRSFGQRLPPSVSEQRDQARQWTVLNRLAVNLNQLTRAVNAGRLPPIDELRTALAHIQSRLDALA
jgi:Bacterial mobilisation protein (MobC)